jgi:hypothetical protein
MRWRERECWGVRIPDCPPSSREIAGAFLEPLDTRAEAAA